MLNNCKWVSGGVMGYKFSAKLMEHSSVGCIDSGKISILSIFNKKGTEVLNYDENGLRKDKSLIVNILYKMIITVLN